MDIVELESMTRKMLVVNNLEITLTQYDDLCLHIQLFSSRENATLLDVKDWEGKIHSIDVNVANQIIVNHILERDKAVV